MIVVACNTATAAAIDQLRASYPDVPFVGMEPALKPAAQLTKSGKVGVLATAGTFKSQRYTQLLLNGEGQPQGQQRVATEQKEVVIQSGFVATAEGGPECAKLGLGWRETTLFGSHRRNRQGHMTKLEPVHLAVG
mgnify:CR=1 FL=1